MTLNDDNDDDNENMLYSLLGSGTQCHIYRYITTVPTCINHKIYIKLI